MKQDERLSSDREGERAMKEAIYRCLESIGKRRNRLTCPSSALPTAGHQAPAGSSLESSFHTWLQKAPHHAGYPAAKSNTRRCALLSLRLLLVLISLCMSFLLTLAMQSMTNTPALAVAPAADAYQMYTSGFCQSFTHEQIPQEWKAAGVCNAGSGQAFVRGGGGACPQDWLKEMTPGGQQECVLTVPSLRSQCPVGFALDGGRCRYQPQGRLGWQVGLCASMKEVPRQWVDTGVCDINPVPNPEQAFVRPSGGGPCQPNWIQTTTRTGRQECVLTVPSFKSACPVGFALDGGRCKYQPQDSGDWQVGFWRSFNSDEVPAQSIQGFQDKTNPVPQHTLLNTEHLT